jgi:hypothetical protein
MADLAMSEQQVEVELANANAFRAAIAQLPLTEASFEN